MEMSGANILGLSVNMESNPNNVQSSEYVPIVLDRDELSAIIARLMLIAMPPNQLPPILQRAVASLQQQLMQYDADAA